jgi:hypothetical protein
MFQALIYSSSGDNVYTTIGIFCANILPPDDEQISAQNMRRLLIIIN